MLSKHLSILIDQGTPLFIYMICLCKQNKSERVGVLGITQNDAEFPINISSWNFANMLDISYQQIGSIPRDLFLHIFQMY